MQKLKLSVVLILTIILMIPPGTVTAQQTLRERKAAGKVDRKPKLAPDLEALLARDDEQEDTKQKGAVKTLALKRQEKLEKHSRYRVNGTLLPSSEIAADEPQSFIVQMSDLASSVALDARLAAFGGRVSQQHDAMGLVTIALPRTAIRHLAAEDSIAYISPDRLINAAGQSHIEVTTAAGQVRQLLKGTELDGRGIGIAILDSGIDDSHKLIKSATKHPGMVAHQDFTGQDAVKDRYGHGTHVAALAAGDKSLKGGSYQGIAPGAKIINVRVLDNDGRGAASKVIAALNWCLANRKVNNYNLRIINLSLGAVAKDSYRNDPLCLAARRAVNAGIIVIAAAGNEGRDADGHKIYGGIHSPGIDPSVITVGAANTFGTDARSDDAVVSWSSRGPTRGYYTDAWGIRHYDNLIKPDLIAPGNKLLSAASNNPDEGKNKLNNLVSRYPSLLTNYKTKLEERVMYLSGTSAAAPVVAGAAALLLQVRPDLTPNLVKAILMYTAQPLKGFNLLEQGAGLLNLDGAVKITSLLRANLAALSNGAEMLTGALPIQQASGIGKEICFWSQGVITNYGFLYGSDLMTRWQSVYSSGAVLADATAVTNGRFGLVSGKTSSGVNLKSGAVSSSGAVLADGAILAQAIVLSNGVLIADGVTLADGLVLSDGVLIADSRLHADTIVKGSSALLGDNTACMQPVP